MAPLRIRTACLLVALGASTTAAIPAPGQGPIQAGVGYVINGPEQFAGASAHALWDLWGGTGLYLDAKWDLDSLVDDRTFTTDFDFQTARDEFRDELVLEEVQWNSFNAAVMRPISDEVVVYAGAGHSRRRAYGEFFDPDEERGAGGLYWVEDPERDDALLNLLGGMFFYIMPNVTVHLGLESAPTGVTVGGSYLFRSRHSPTARLDVRHRQR